MKLYLKQAIAQYFRSIFKPGSQYRADTMLQAFIWIGAASIIAILALSTFTVYVITTREVTRDAMVLAVKVSQSMFGQHRELLSSLDNRGQYRLDLNEEDVPKIDTFIRSYLHPFDILKVKIYSPAGKIIYSSDAKIIGIIDHDNKRLQRALSGAVDSHIVKKDKMLDLVEETKFNVSVVETYIPIVEGSTVIGVFEIYTDVTSFNQDIVKIVERTILSLTIILLFVFGCSFLVVNKATQLLKNTQHELADKVKQLEEALIKVRQLEGIIPICSYCKKIRDDEKSWHQLENYISSHSEAKFSHGICPECYEKQMLEINAMSK
ncbi:MAG: hypothetical protein A2076_01140 [Geobacteraceae bacterium GWC2_53_11]|nr:MAG: hypothetical protein A2076_01140 [Geobacteraceae bacterium GWC2_53_11]